MTSPNVKKLRFLSYQILHQQKAIFSGWATFFSTSKKMGIKPFFGQVEEGISQNTKTVVYLKRATMGALGSVIPIAAIIIGVMFFDQCPGGFDIGLPQCLIVCSSMYTFSLLLATLGFKNTALTFGIMGGCVHSALCLLVLFTVTGPFKVNYEDPDDKEYCNQFFHLFSCAYSILFCGFVIGAMMYWCR